MNEKLYKVVNIYQASSGFGEFEAGIPYGDLFTLEGYLEDINWFDATYRLGQDELPAGVKDIRGLVHNEPEIIFYIIDGSESWYTGLIPTMDAKTERLYHEYERENGLSWKDGKPYWLTQPAYVIGDGTQYEAMAVDLEGNEYLLTWETTEDWDSREDQDKSDESEACDWNNFTAQEYLSYRVYGEANERLSRSRYLPVGFTGKRRIEMSIYEEKKQQRIERYHELAEKNRQLSNSLAEQSIKMIGVIPMGQPVMGVRDANYRARALDKMSKSVELQSKADYYNDKAMAADNDIISSDDPEALNKLHAKLKLLEEKRETYKAANKQAKAEDKDILPSYVLQNLGQNIKSVKDRITRLEKQEKEAAAHSGENVVIYESDAYKLIKNFSENRIQFLFNEKPSEEIRNFLKHWGFRWSPSNSAWQRQLNNAGLYAAKCVAKEMK